MPLFSNIAHKHLKVACELGMYPDEFFKMIPYEFIVYAKSRAKFLRKQNEIQQRNFALIATVIANVNRGKNKPPYKIEDFMPRKKQTVEDMYKMVVALNSQFGGEDKREQNGSS